MKEVYDKIYGLYNEILKIPMDSPKYFELYKEYIKLLILVSSNNPSFNDDVKKYLYTGAEGMFFAPGASRELMKEGLSRFKPARAALLATEVKEALEAYELGFRIFFCMNQEGKQIAAELQKKALGISSGRQISLSSSTIPVVKSLSSICHSFLGIMPYSINALTYPI